MKWIIRSLSTTAGFLEASRIEFSERLTCIIGARGTCKSTIVETVRFAFDCDTSRVRQLVAHDAPSTPNDAIPARGLVRATLQDGTIRCEIVDAHAEDGSTYVLERTVDSRPRLFRDGVQQIDADEQLNRIEIYSQGDLQRIAEEPSKRLRLIDRPNQDEVNKLLASRNEAAEKLRDLGPAIRRTKNEIESRRNTLRSLDAFRIELEHLQGNRPQLSSELDAARRDFAARKSMLELAEGAARVWQEAATAIKSAIDRRPQLLRVAAECKNVRVEESKHVAESFEQFAAFLEQAGIHLDKIQDNTPSPHISALRSRFEQQDAHYYALRKEQQELNESLRREDSLRSQIQRLEEVERELSVFEHELSKLIRQRHVLREQIEQVGEKLYEMRLRQVDSINESYGSIVLLTLQHGSRSDEQRMALSTLLAGSRIRNQDEVAADLAEKLRPSDVVDAVEAGDAKRLADGLDRDLGQMTRLVSYLLDNPKLYQLEGIVYEDQLEITLFVDGEPKPISQLSKGQMATALLPLILRPAPYPLIFDQPEDDLDNAFVFRTLIGKILELKLERQLIFVTHNANIPVLGDAEAVVVMSMAGPRKAASPQFGNVDSAKAAIISLLEGGREAFTMRQQRYSDALSSSGGLK